MKKRILSIILTICVLVSMLNMASISASAATYSVANAIAYAQAHWNDGVGLCSEFVSRCVMAGGVNTGVKARVRDLWPKICSLTGLSMETLALDANGYATKALDGHILAKGDVVVQWCSTHNIGPHVLLCGGYDSSGYATYYAHNGAINNKKYKLSINEAYEHTRACDMGGKVVRLSTLDKNASNTNSALVAALASFSKATQAEYANKEFVTENNACVVNQVNKQSGVAVTKMGLYLYKSDGTLIKKHTENISNVSKSQTLFHSWYDINKELEIVLEGGTVYKYKFFGVFNGVEIAASSFGTFETKGSKKVLVQFVADIDGKEKWNQSLTVGKKIGSFPAPIVPKNYEFVGWYTEKTGGKRVTESTTFDGSTTVYYAQFKNLEKQTVTVYFDANGGKCTTTKVKVIPGSKLDTIPTPTRKGYVFKGWYTDDSLGNKKVGTTTVFNMNSDTTVYAKWERDNNDMLGDEYIFPFEDVKSNDWYYKDVLNAHKLGLINGKSNKKYVADENVTYAEAIKLAACMHQLYEKGEVTLTNSSKVWYQNYVDYAKKNGIPWKCKDYDAKISRKDYVHIFYYALPESCYEEINSIKEIPDVEDDEDYSDEIYTFYRAGILSGSDSKGSFKPLSNIKRSEVATILSRMMDEETRKKFTLR